MNESRANNANVTNKSAADGARFGRPAAFLGESVGLLSESPPVY